MSARNTGRGRLAPLMLAAMASQALLVVLAPNGAWAGLLTFVGALFIERLGASAAETGFLLAAGATGFLAASSRSRAIAARASRRHAVAAAMAASALLVLRVDDPREPRRVRPALRRPALL